MKEMYEQPYMELIEFDAEDIVTTSGGGAAVLPDDEF